jgi:hypothetical protein
MELAKLAKVYSNPVVSHMHLKGAKKKKKKKSGNTNTETIIPIHAPKQLNIVGKYKDASSSEVGEKG